MNDLDTLRPEVHTAMEAMDADVQTLEWLCIRAELLRLADENKRMRGIIETLDIEGHRRAEKAEAEIAALKARIAEAPVAYLTSKTGVGPCNVASMAHGVVFDSSSYGKSVRVVLDE